MDSEYLQYFPYDSPYPHQREAMDRIGEALEDGNNVLFEGATGTGKTLAALAPALCVARRTDKTVVITTNVHQQMRQFRREASAIAATEPIRAVVFRGKGSMCHIDVGYQECQTLRDTTRELVDAEADVADLERKQRELLEAGQTGDSDAMEARGAIMDELEAAQASVADFEDRATCEHYYRNLTADTGQFFTWLYEDVRTPDEIYEFADREGLCGYELLKEGVEGVDLVVCNYHHLLDATIREQFLRWLGRDPEDVIAIFDEAHNVEGAARDHARRTLSEQTLASAVDELEGCERETAAAENVIGAFLEGLQTAYRDAFSFGERERVGEEWYDLAIDNEAGRDDLTLGFLDAYSGPGVEQDLEVALSIGRDLDAEYERAFKNGDSAVRTECQTLQAARFIEAWLADSDWTGTYPVVSVRRRDGGAETSDESGHATQRSERSSASARGEVYGRAELYNCIPRQVTQSLFEETYANVLMSATLRPFDVTQAVLGLEDVETMAYGQQFPPERRRTYAVDGPALFASKRDDEAVMESITATLRDVVRFTPGNTLVFFPSYSEAQRYHDRLEVGTRYLDQPGTPAHDLREEFTADDDGVLLTSLWGTLGEGVSYDGDDARAVVVVGVPYPHLDDRLEAVQEAYDAVFGDVGERGADDVGWEYAVAVPTIRKTRQALGRVIRSPEDVGVRVLLDGRYTERAAVEMPQYAVRSHFPPEERAELLDVEPDKLKYALYNFFREFDGWDGDPPRPD